MALNDLHHLKREPRGEPNGALVLFHGRGTSEHDLFPLFGMLDPDQQILGVTPRAPLSLPPGGAHWYAVYRVGFPDPETFLPTYERAAGWLDSFYEDSGLGPEKTVLGGFSQGAVMSFALGLGKGRPRPAGIMALSGFIPTVEGFEIDLSDLQGYPVAIGHGIYDPIITVSFAREAKEKLEGAGADLLYRESPMDHTIDPDYIDELQTWLAKRF